MYCRKCGNKKSDVGMYCRHDGMALIKPLVVTTKIKTTNYCSSCGMEQREDGNYCATCGETTKQFVVSSKKKNEEESIHKLNVHLFTKTKVSFAHIKKAVMALLIMVALLATVSFVVMDNLENQMEQSTGMAWSDIQEELEYGLGTSLPSVENLFNTPDVMMVANLQLPKVSGVLEDDWQKINFNGSVTGALSVISLLTMLFLFISGIFHGQLMKGEKASIFQSVCLFSGMYAISMSVLAIFAGFSIDNQFEEVLVSGGLSYSFFGTLLTTVILAFIFHGMGYLFSINYRQSTGLLGNMIPFGESIHQGISTIFRGSIALFLGVFGYMLIKLNSVRDFFGYMGGMDQISELIQDSIVFVMGLALQLSQWLYGIAHFGTFTFHLEADGEKGSVLYSLLSGMDFTGGATELEVYVENIMYYAPYMDFSNVRYVLWGMVVFFILLFVWSGYRIGLRAGKAVSNIAVYSLCYGVLLALVASVSQVGFEWSYWEEVPNQKGLLYLGVSWFGMFVRGTIFSFVFAFIGSRFAKR